MTPGPLKDAVSMRNSDPKIFKLRPNFNYGPCVNHDLQNGIQKQYRDEMEHFNYISALFRVFSDAVSDVRIARGDIGSWESNPLRLV